MNYQQTINYLFEQLPMYQRKGPIAYKADLNNTHALDQLFDYPHSKYKTIHIAGTNGKGSTSHILASILQEAGYKVGLYTSPHLIDFRERIKVNGQMISEEAVCSFVSRFNALNKDNIQPSFFEMTVSMAFDYFAAQKVDFAVIEVGLGGRLDSTNIITPLVSVITNISLDHTNLLGNTIELIALEKAGIVKPGVPVIIGETDVKTSSIFKNKAKVNKAKVVFADQNYRLKKNNFKSSIFDKDKQEIISELQLDLIGNYQDKNLITSVATINTLKKIGIEISVNAITKGVSKVIQNTGLLGRWQQIGTSPKIICDTGHNSAGIKWITKQLKDENYNNLHFVFGTVNDKNIEDIITLLPKNATYYFTQASIDRALPVNKLMEICVHYKLKGNAYKTVSKAVAAAKENANSDDLIFIGGSTFVVAEVL